MTQDQAKNQIEATISDIVMQLSSDEDKLDVLQFIQAYADEEYGLLKEKTREL